MSNAIENQKKMDEIRILDACCGSRMFWYQKNHKNTLYMDIREFEGVACDGRQIKVLPDLVADYRNMPFPNNSFQMVVFDPPHLKWAGENSWLKQKYGKLDSRTWKEDLTKGFSECFRVLAPNGFLIFKWNEDQIPIHEVVKLSNEMPLFGQKGGKTHWLVYMKHDKEAE
jgi:SAM-dependent methyltransferase